MDVTVPVEAAGMRLDRFLAQHLPFVSRRALRAQEDELRLNGHPARRSAALRAGDVVTVPDAMAQARQAAPNPRLRIAILFEDEAIIALDKPAGLPSAALRQGEVRSVASFLVAHDPATAPAGSSALEAGLVHRLDRDTSGVILAARTPAAYAVLRRQFSRHEVKKEYLTLVAGDVTQAGSIDNPIAHDRRHRGRVRVCRTAEAEAALEARPAQTLYRPEIRYDSRATLLRVTIRSGVMHQIRAHLAFIGHPVLGDALYGGTQAAPRDIPRQVLHASRIEIRHPVTAEPLTVESPLPEDLRRVLHDFASRKPWTRRRAASFRSRS